MTAAKHYDWLSHHAHANPEAPCWTDLHSSRSYTYTQAEDRCRRLASHLARNCGVTKGDRVAMLAMNSTDVMEVHSACARIGAYGPDALVISLGVDTFKDDPISFFRLESEDFRTYGSRLAKLGLPTLFVMEGGYAVEEIGVNTVNVLEGFSDE